MMQACEMRNCFYYDPNLGCANDEYPCSSLIDFLLTEIGRLKTLTHQSIEGKNLNKGLQSIITKNCSKNWSSAYSLDGNADRAQVILQVRSNNGTEEIVLFTGEFFDEKEFEEKRFAQDGK